MGSEPGSQGAGAEDGHESQLPEEQELHPSDQSPRQRVMFPHELARALGFRAEKADTAAAKEVLSKGVTDQLKSMKTDIETALAAAEDVEEKRMLTLQLATIEEVAALHIKVNLAPFFKGPAQSASGEEVIQLHYQHIEDYGAARYSEKRDLDTFYIYTNNLGVLTKLQCVPPIENTTHRAAYLQRTRGHVLLRQESNDVEGAIPRYTPVIGGPGSQHHLIYNRPGVAMERDTDADGAPTHRLPWLVYVGIPANARSSTVHMLQTRDMNLTSQEGGNAFASLVAWFVQHGQLSTDFDRDALYSSGVRWRSQGRKAFHTTDTLKWGQSYPTAGQHMLIESNARFYDVGLFSEFLEVEYAYEESRLTPAEVTLAKEMLPTVRFLVGVQEKRCGLGLSQMVPSPADVHAMDGIEPEEMSEGGGGAGAAEAEAEEEDPLMALGRAAQAQATSTAAKRSSILRERLSPDAYAERLQSALRTVIQPSLCEDDPNLELFLFISVGNEYSTCQELPDGRVVPYKVKNNAAPGGATSLTPDWMMPNLKNALNHRDMSPLKPFTAFYKGDGNFSAYGACSMSISRNGGLPAPAPGDDAANGLLAMMGTRADGQSPDVKMYGTAHRSIAYWSHIRDGQKKLMQRLLDRISSGATGANVAAGVVKILGEVKEQSVQVFR